MGSSMQSDLLDRVHSVRQAFPRLPASMEPGPGVRGSEGEKAAGLSAILVHKYVQTVYTPGSQGQLAADDPHRLIFP
jgi:hypothetical protein